MLRKEVYTYKYMGSLQIFNYQITSLPDKKEFCSNLNIKGAKDSHFKHAKRVSMDFKLKYLDDYHDLYEESDTLLIVL